jgi:hypothetical protein
LNPIIPILKPFGLSFNTFFQIDQKPPSPIKKPDLVSCTQHTLPNAKNCMGTSFYNKLK